ncbi:MAG: biotin biosynthesis protein BioC [Rickettsiaceae bacterium]|jgi:predicted TPR repeat methyltransferase|nr:biotin biosynthesis protein BioC [Rickettsiaceae bacterium]
MNIFKMTRYFDLKYWTKKWFGDADIKDQSAKFMTLIQKKWQEFLQDCDEAREKLKDIPGTNYKLGILHMRRGNVSDAIMRFRMVIFLTPEHVGARCQLAKCLLMVNEEESARDMLQKVLEMDKDNTDAKYQLSKLNNRETLNTIPLSVIREKVDISADNYIAGDLAFTKTFISTVLLNINDKNPNLSVLDLGCGDGEAGQLLRDKEIVKNITGVDLSDKMLKLAQKRKIGEESVYNNLANREISEYLSVNNDKFDLILANGSLKYFGNIKEIFSLVKKSLKPSAIFAFAINKAELDKDYRLNIGEDNFSFSQGYIRDALNSLGFNELQIKEVQNIQNNSDIDKVIFIYKNL